MADELRVHVNVAETQLKAGALRLPSIFMQSLTMVAPGIAGVFYTPVIVGQAGLAAPLAYPLAAIALVITALCFAQLARALPSSGGYYTYVSRGLHPRLGFLVAWMSYIYTPLVLGAVLVFGGYVWSSSLGWPEWFPLLFMVCGGIFVAAMQYRGVQVSGKLLVVLGAIEVIVVFALGLWGMAFPGPGGFNLQPLNPANAKDLGGIAIAVIFAVQAFSGWEGSAPMAEETENPRRNVPLALVGSVLIFAVFIIVVQFGIMVGWGTDQFAKIPSASPLPGIQLAQRYWGGAWVILLLMLMSSTIAVSIACANVSTRMWYKMGLDGAFPKWFAKVHPVYRTPTNAILFQLLLVFVVGFGLTGAAMLLNPGDHSLLTALQNQYYMDGTSIGFNVAFIYGMVVISSFALYWRERRHEFNWILHGLFPLIALLFMVAIVVASTQPLPGAPLVYAVYFTGFWLILGVVVLLYLRSTHKEGWMLRAGEAVAERPATDDELRAMAGEW